MVFVVWVGVKGESAISYQFVSLSGRGLMWMGRMLISELTT